MNSPCLLYAFPDDDRIVAHPSLSAIGRSGDELVLPADRPLRLPSCSTLMRLPGCRPIGYDPETGRVEVLDLTRGRGARRVAAEAVAAVLPPGYTRTLLPACQRPPQSDAHREELPQWAYSAAGAGAEGEYVWAMRTDRRTHWSPTRFSTTALPGLVTTSCAELPKNPVLRHLASCALEYRCFTAQNIFYSRDEGGIPSSAGCNARCLGCISQRRPGGAPSSMERLTRPPTPQAMAEVGIRHLSRAKGRAMVSFGQGCEGEPLTRGEALVETVRLIRAKCDRGSININTNGSRTATLEALFAEGLDAVRVSLNSAHPELYRAYYRPVGYDFCDVERSLAAARAEGAYIALNLLMLPGINDRAGEVERLAELIVRYRVNQLQTRSLAMDWERPLAAARGVGAGGAAIGVRGMLAVLRREAPWLTIGNFARGLEER